MYRCNLQDGIQNVYIPLSIYIALPVCLAAGRKCIQSFKTEEINKFQYEVKTGLGEPKTGLGCLRFKNRTTHKRTLHDMHGIEDSHLYVI